jgi:hypothetical protein
LAQNNKRNMLNMIYIYILINFSNSAKSFKSVRPISANYILRALKIEKNEPVELSNGI